MIKNIIILLSFICLLSNQNQKTDVLCFYIEDIMKTSVADCKDSCSCGFYLTSIKFRIIVTTMHWKGYLSVMSDVDNVPKMTVLSLNTSFQHPLFIELCMVLLSLVF